MDTQHVHQTRKQAIVALQGRIQAWERRSSQHSTEIFTTGCDALDVLFPARGVRRGSLIEWLGDGESSGVGTLSLIAGRRVCPAGEPCVVIDTRHDLYLLSLSLLGFDLARLVVISPASERDALWACEEALRCEAVGLVWANIERLTSTSFRRLQLAAEASSGIGFLVRSAKAVRQPSWAEVRLRVQPRPSRRGALCCCVDVVSHPGNPADSTADIWIDSVKGTLHGNTQPADSLPLVSRMDAATAHRRSTGA